jgi:hypothetical protein
MIKNAIARAYSRQSIKIKIPSNSSPRRGISGKEMASKAENRTKRDVFSGSAQKGNQFSLAKLFFLW